MHIAHHAATGALTIVVTLTCAPTPPPVPTQEQVVTEHNLYTHHCHEDEYQYVTPEGLTCTPIDGGTTYVVATEYEFARPH